MKMLFDIINRASKIIISNYVWLGLILLSFAGCSNPDVYLFSSFRGNGEDGLHLSYSEDGLTWNVIHNDKALLLPSAGEDKLMRDPCIIHGRDGRFHMVWTVSWNEKGIGYASSEDLIHWSPQEYLPVMEHLDSTRNCWAPELFYDASSKLYYIYWASTVVGRFTETDSLSENGYNHRMYFTSTPDFVDFAPTQVLFDQGFNAIDATIIKHRNQYVMFVKDETLLPEAEKNIRMSIADKITGPYSSVSEPITHSWVEGPTVLHKGEDWIVYFDQYTKHKMGAISSRDLKQWEDISNLVHFPEGTRHGSVFTVKRPILENLLDYYEK